MSIAARAMHTPATHQKAKRPAHSGPTPLSMKNCGKPPISRGIEAIPRPLKKPAAQIGRRPKQSDIAPAGPTSRSTTIS